MTLNLIQNRQPSTSTPTTVFKFVALPDLHIGHYRVNMNSFFNNIQTYVYPQLEDIDILFIPGDWFHTLFTLSSPAGYRGVEFMRDLSRLSLRYNFKIRMVTGTFLHDRDQHQFWNLFTHDNNIAVFDSIHIEELLGLRILYIPDHSPKNSMDIIKRLMKDRGIDKLDMVIGHGYFEHNLPKAAKVHDCVFKASDFEHLVKGFVVFGHDHQHAVYKNIISGGSFDRHRHGEEEPKGFPVLYYNKETGQKRCEFIENKNSTIFKTIDSTHLDNVKDVVDFFNQTVYPIAKEREPVIIYIRVLSDDPDVNEALRELVRKRFPNVILTFKRKTVKEVKKLRDTSVQHLTIINQTNLSDLIYKEIKGDLSKKDIESVLEEISSS